VDVRVVTIQVRPERIEECVRIFRDPALTLSEATPQTLIALVRGLHSQHPLVGGTKREHAHRRRPRGGFRLESDSQES
jgi:hypothetical protein